MFLSIPPLQPPPILVCWFFSSSLLVHSIELKLHQIEHSSASNTCICKQYFLFMRKHGKSMSTVYFFTDNYKHSCSENGEGPSGELPDWVPIEHVQHLRWADMGTEEMPGRTEILVLFAIVHCHVLLQHVVGGHLAIDCSFVLQAFGGFVRWSSSKELNSIFKIHKNFNFNLESAKRFFLWFWSQNFTDFLS